MNCHLLVWHWISPKRKDRTLKMVVPIYKSKCDTNCFHHKSPWRAYKLCISHLSASSRPSMKHSKYFPSLELQKTVISPWITLNESNLLHWILNLVNKLCWLTISGSFNLTRIFRGPVTSTITFEGAWGRPEVSKPKFNFLRPLKRFCHKFRCLFTLFQMGRGQLAAADDCGGFDELTEFFHLVFTLID